MMIEACQNHLFHVQWPIWAKLLQVVGDENQGISPDTICLHNGVQN